MQILLTLNVWSTQTAKCKSRKEERSIKMISRNEFFQIKRKEGGVSTVVGTEQDKCEL